MLLSPQPKSAQLILVADMPKQDFKSNFFAKGYLNYLLNSDSLFAAKRQFVQYEVEVRGKDNQMMTLDFSFKAIIYEQGEVFF